MNLKQMQEKGRELWNCNHKSCNEIHGMEAKDLDEHTAATWKAALDSILESGLLDEKEEHQDWCKLTGELEYASCGCWKDHNTLARAIKAHLDELIKSTSI